MPGTAMATTSMPSLRKRVIRLAITRMLGIRLLITARLFTLTPGIHMQNALTQGIPPPVQRC